MSISDSKQVSRGAIHRASCNESIQDNLILIPTFRIPLQVICNAIVILFRNLRNRLRVGYELQHAIINGKCNQIVNRKHHIISSFLQSLAENAEELQDQLVLYHVITCLEHYLYVLWLIRILASYFVFE